MYQTDNYGPNHALHRKLKVNCKKKIFSQICLYLVVVYDLAHCLLRLQNYCTSTQPDKDSRIDNRQTAKKETIGT